MPASATLPAGYHGVFTATMNGVATTNVAWSLSSAIGSVNRGIYYPPGWVESPQTVTLIARNLANPGQVAYAYITVIPRAGTSPTNVTTSVPPPTPTLSVAPAWATVNAGGSLSLVPSLGGGASGGVSWSLSPAVGTISSSGIYSAPSVVSSVVNVQVTATLISNPSVKALATLQISPAVSVSVSVSPATATLRAGWHGVFSAQVTGSSNTKVFWSLSPNVGTVVDGLYYPPSFLTSTQIITLTATSSADPSKRASALITVHPASGPATQAAPQTLTVLPSSLNLPPGSTVNLSAMLNGTATSDVTWSLSPVVGNITSGGTYIAPTSLSSPLVVTATARLRSNTSVAASATLQVAPAVAVSIFPASATLQAPYHGVFTATVTGTSNTAVNWSITPNIGRISGGLYYPPSTVSTPQNVTILATSVADPSRVASATVTVTPAPSSSAAPPATSSGIRLPVEIYGPNGTQSSETFNLDATSAASAQYLYLRIHGLSSELEGSVQLNNGPWIALNSLSFKLFPLDTTYGGIGGGFSTVRGRVTIQPSWLTSGANTIRFRFNQTDGVSHGFRVLAFNLQNAAFVNLIPANVFTEDNPASWTAPLPDANSIAAGRQLWFNAQLTSPLSGSIKAKCADCHAQDGRDLKYFNYSNKTISTRAVFHGLSSTQGDQIASYIRSLNVPAPGRPWNPPYQPGPGVDSRPVTEWAAGAGIDAVLDSDLQTLQSIFPNGYEPSRILPSANLSAREVPVAIQLPDWNRWLPRIHPKDAFPGFENSEWFKYYTYMRSTLRPGSASSYLAVREAFASWIVRRNEFLSPYVPSGGPWNDAQVSSHHGARLWQMTKGWELMQEFQLEGFGRSYYGPLAEERTWPNQDAFMASPNMTQMPADSKFLNGTRNASIHSNAGWYQLQLILNNSNKYRDGTSPIDWPYAFQSILVMHEFTPQDGMLTLWLAKGFQVLENGKGPENPGLGWAWNVANVPRLGHWIFSNIYDPLGPANKRTVVQMFLRQWLDKVKSFSPQAFYTGGWTSNTETVDPIVGADKNFPSRVHAMIGAFKQWGVDNALLRETADWAQTMWPRYSWRAGLGL